MVNRKFLYWGVFLVAFGGVLLLGQSETVGGDLVAQALRFWPVAVIGLGVALLLRGTQFGLAGGVVAAAMPGLLLGGMIVIAPDIAHECRINEPTSVTARQGTFDGPASVELSLGCGELSVTTAPGTGWQVETATLPGAMAEIDASGERLMVASAKDGGRFRFPFHSDWSGDTFSISLPTGSRLDLNVEVNAGRGRLDLAGAQLGELNLQLNAGDLQVDLTGATVAHLSTETNVGSARVLLPASGDFDANFEVNAGEITICAPAGLGLRIQEEVVLGSTSYTGLVRNGDAWETPGYLVATQRADVTVSVNVGSVDVNPEGGCK